MNRLLFASSWIEKKKKEESVQRIHSRVFINLHLKANNMANNVQQIIISDT